MNPTRNILGRDNDVFGEKHDFNSPTPTAIILLF